MGHRRKLEEDGKTLSKSDCSCGRVFNTPAKLGKHVQKANIALARGKKE